MSLARLAPLLFAAVGIGLALGATAAPVEAGKPRAQRPVQGRVVPGLTHVRDGHARRRTGLAHKVESSAYGGRIRASNGEYVRVRLSNAYAPDRRVLQAYADFVAGLQHGRELSAADLLVAPPAEIAKLCDEGSDGCYDPETSVLAVIGSDSDQAYIEFVVAHEYGHHLAENRRNDPWDAYFRGPKYWSTYENVCHRVRAGTAFPDTEDDNYDYALDPGEDFAEAFAVLNGFPWEGDIFDNSFRPDRGALGAINKDVLHPSRGNNRYRRRGRFARAERSRVVRLRKPHDGRVDVRLRARGADDLVLYTKIGRRNKVLKRARHRGRHTRLRYTICGNHGPLRLKVIRRRGPGWYRMKISQP